MTKILTFALAFAALAIAAVGIWCWYNKDRYQFIDGHSQHLAAPSVFDRNTGSFK